MSNLNKTHRYENTITTLGFALICLGCIASQAQEYEYVPIVRENVRYTFSDGQTMTILPDNRYVNGQLYAYAYMPDFSYRAKDF